VTAPRGSTPDTRIGLISDTHGVVPGGVAQALEGVSLIIHAGDVGPECVIGELSAIAPVEAVAGNTDHAFVSGPLPATRTFTHGGLRFFVSHRFEPHRQASPGGVDIVVAGHTHLPEVLDLGDALLVNPGSASRSRTPDGIGTVAVIEHDSGRPRVRIVQLDGDAEPHR
jgi:putative phosphoesterase